MGGKSVYAQSYRTQSKSVIAYYARPRGVREVPLRPARSTSTNTTLARQFATCQRQRFVDRFRLNARFRIRLFFTGRWGRVFVIFSHSVFP